MSVPIKPLPKGVLAKPIEPSTKTASGIYLPEGVAEKTNEAVVEAIGEDVKNVKVGNTIIYKSYSSNDYKGYIFVKEEDILATVGENNNENVQKPRAHKPVKKARLHV